MLDGLNPLRIRDRVNLVQQIDAVPRALERAGFDTWDRNFQSAYDLLLDPEQLFPPPQIRGKLTDIKIQGNELLLIFGARAAQPGLYKSGGNYMAFLGGQLRFGKLTMDNSDMVLIDTDTKDPFDFFLGHYKEQLAAGYSKNTLQDGLRVHMPDYGKLKVRRNKQ